VWYSLSDSDVDEEQFAVVYHLHNWYENKRIKIKAFLTVKTRDQNISNIFEFQLDGKRAFDFYGVDFIGHPQLKRILNMDEMISHPMRKEFPMEDGGRTDKDDRFFGRTIDNC
jgi:NADH-quinone oxidoreductase subunit C